MMIVPNDVLRFSFDDVYHGLAECKGLLRLSENHIVIEYVVKDSFVGFFKSNVKTLKLNYDKMIDAEMINTFWKKRLILRPLSMFDSSDFPVTEEGEIHLKLKKDKTILQTAERLATFINMRIAEIKLERLER